MAQDEWYSPPTIVEAARRTMGGIDLDPFSCAKANEIIKATRIHTIETDGFKQAWFGRVWCNPPYSRGMLPRFVVKLAIEQIRIRCAIVLVNADTSTQWCQWLLAHSDGACFIATRLPFIPGNGQPNPGGRLPQAVFRFGCDRIAFSDNFNEFGRVY